MNTKKRAGLILIGCCTVLLVASNVQADTRDLRVEGKKPAEYVAGQTGKSYAVVIGINDYEKVRRLTYAEADAKAVADTLTQQGFAVTTLYNRQATRNNILDELGDKLVDRVGEHDRVLIYFAGHGETKQPKGGKEMGFLLPVEADQKGLARTSIPMSLIRDLADGLPAKQVLFVVDVCYGGIAGQQFRSLPKYTAEYLKAITRERGRQLITAGGPKQEAMEGPEWGHSVFTYYLLEGLNKGTADLNSDGIIPASELYAYLDERVFSAAQMKGHTQRPVMWTMAAEKGEFVFLTDRKSPIGSTAGSGIGTTTPTFSAPAPSAALSQAEQELQALEAQEQAVDAQAKQAELQRRIDAKKQQLAEKKKQLEVASLPSYSQKEDRLRQKQEALARQEAEEQTRRQAPLEAQNNQVEEHNKKLQLAKSYTIPRQTGREMTGKDGAPMALVPEGEFIMGGEEGERFVTVAGFYMDKYEVTTELYAKFLQATERQEPTYWESGGIFSTATWKAYGSRPVVGVDWRDADAYCRQYGKRLPTEQEWEKAARGTDGRMYPWGNEEPTSRHALYNTTWNGYGTLAVVGSHAAGASPYEIQDLAGNVLEWTSSDWDSDTKVVRGGSWNSAPVVLRSAPRYWGHPTRRSAYIGFRCAQDAR